MSSNNNYITFLLKNKASKEKEVAYLKNVKRRKITSIEFCKILFLLLNIYLFSWEREREKQTARSSSCWFTLRWRQLLGLVQANACSLEPGPAHCNSNWVSKMGDRGASAWALFSCFPRPGYPMWMGRVQVLGLPFIVFSSTIAGSWIRTSTLLWDVGIKGHSFICCAINAGSWNRNLKMIQLHLVHKNTSLNIRKIQFKGRGWRKFYLVSD